MTYYEFLEPIEWEFGSNLNTEAIYQRTNQFMALMRLKKNSLRVIRSS